jgi:hypothetical protein
MYYYLFEPPKEAKDYERSAQVKEYLSQLGIAGEMVSPLPGKSVEDLVTSAISKRYSTVIAVGGMELANRVARALEPHDAVFGIIPLKPHEDIAALIGTSDWKQAAENLKRRRCQSVRLGSLQDSFCFLTPARVRVSGGFVLQTPDFDVEGQDLLISVAPTYADEHSEPRFSITLEPFSPAKRGLLGNLFSRRPSAPAESRFLSDEAVLHTDTPASIEIAGVSLTTTPANFKMQERSIRLIVGKNEI